MSELLSSVWNVSADRQEHLPSLDLQLGWSGQLSDPHPHDSSRHLRSPVSPLSMAMQTQLTYRANIDEIRRGMTNNKNLEVTCELLLTL
jgi:hypothetical protein